MLGYASLSPVATRKASPTSIAVIVGAHLGLLALAMTAKMEIAAPITEPPMILLPPDSPPPPPPQPNPPASHRPTPPTHPIDTARPVIPIHPTDFGPLPTFPTEPLDGNTIATVEPLKLQPHRIVRIAPRSTTSDGDLRPPYPAIKQRDGEEAVLPLRLTIAADGRVTAVDPIGAVDPLFLASARRHILRHWHYRPATEDGQPVATTLIVRLQFKLEDAA